MPPNCPQATTIRNHTQGTLATTEAGEYSSFNDSRGIESQIFRVMPVRYGVNAMDDEKGKID